jgi:hypothetical protein
VLLIAFTLAIGAFMSGWIQTLTSEQVNQVEESVKTKCNWAAINTNNEKWNSSHLTFELENIGTSDITVESVQILYDNGTLKYGDFNSTTIKSNELKFVNISNVGDNKTAATTTLKESGVAQNISKVRIITECPGLYIDIDDSQISGAI